MACDQPAALHSARRRGPTDGRCSRETERSRGEGVRSPKLARGSARTAWRGRCISELVTDCADMEKRAAFWSAVLGYVELGREEDEIEIGSLGVGFGGPQPTLILSPSTEPKRTKLRLHIDVNPTDRDQEEELERLLSLGARKVDVGQTGEESWHVLADPEGNEFCLLRRRSTRSRSSDGKTFCADQRPWTVGGRFPTNAAVSAVLAIAGQLNGAELPWHGRSAPIGQPRSVRGARRARAGR
jgi:catechol 2,3-dioxygenase-like lactoylglutathione lyase family enzyme